MVSAATLDDLQRFVKGERLGEARVHLEVDTVMPEVGKNVVFRWNFEDHGIDIGTLHIDGKSRLLVPRVGQLSVVAGAEYFTANLRVGNDSTSVQIIPQVIIPTISLLYIPKQGFVDKPVKIRWESHQAERCLLKISNGMEVQTIEVDPCAETEISPNTIGDLTVALTVFSKHADISELAAVTCEKIMHIKESPVTIHMSRKSLSAPIGETVSFNWSVMGADRIYLHALDRNEVLSVPAYGQMQVEVDFTDEHFCLIAVSKSGRKKKLAFEVVPELIATLTGAINLDSLGNKGGL